MCCRWSYTGLQEAGAWLERQDTPGTGWQFITGLMYGAKHSHSHSHLQAVKSYRLTIFACFGVVGGNHNTLRGEHTNSTQKGTLLAIKPRTFSVWGDSANHCMLCCILAIISVIQMNTVCWPFFIFCWCHKEACVFLSYYHWMIWKQKADNILKITLYEKDLWILLWNPWKCSDCQFIILILSWKVFRQEKEGRGAVERSFPWRDECYLSAIG